MYRSHDDGYSGYNSALDGGPVTDTASYEHQNSAISITWVAVALASITVALLVVPAGTAALVWNVARQIQSRRRYSSSFPRTGRREY